MSRIVACEFLSLDGCFSGPPGQEMDFVISHFSPGLEEDLARQYESVEAFIMGRTTFDALGSYWPTAAARGERLVEPMNALPKLVVSSRPDVSSWAPAEHLSDPVAMLRARKQRGEGDLMVIGSASVVGLLLRHRLVDELRLLVFPELVPGGRRLFERSVPPSRWITTRAQTFESGVVALTYAIKDEAT